MILVIEEAALICKLLEIAYDRLLPYENPEKPLLPSFNRLVLQADDVGFGVGAFDTPSALAYAASPYSEVHLNIATPLSLEAALAIAKREGWTARLCDRGGDFQVIEFWLENKFMLELMTELELKRYRNVTSAVWRARIAQGQQALPVSPMFS